MVKYLIRRILVSIPTLIAISIVIFTILALAPGDPMGEFALNSGITAEVRENIRRSLGLDQPTHIRYIKWVTAFISGDMGYSFTSRLEVSSLIFQRLPVTLWIVGFAYLLGALLAVPLGVISALKRNSAFDMVLTTLVFFGFSLPTFFTSLLLIIIFSVQLKWLPFIYNDTLQLTDFNSFIELIKQSIMPIFVLGLWQTAVLMRFVRSEILENIHKDYVRTAYAKGLPNYIVIIRHVLRNALIPVVTLLALDIPSIFTGALVTEKVFRIPGIGALLIDSINSRDTPVVMSITFIYGILIVIFNLIADILYGLLDPRVSSTK
ncbi:ABC transporter substrate-binding protein [Dulcicalothrix desertica PCC 7102]|uniref:ABC transporter substrate-binding protein n=1 Tax=Dulcicalothrix desertica PCC 7102 TaxID=232991 RepID=A0A433VK40_9CYAN|nr:ABC transporter permease [Dulcicalothrix desertica]RUT06450.1 ABC transporter substrate-binding protein [Dulcicalothrix desertica PCC 7102]TWH50406.1 peptide/nickel transport system permease protein [Dulcicalothrix desertica PCC 7102]